eukprot:6521_1
MSQLIIFICTTLTIVLCQHNKNDPASFCGCNMNRDYHAYPQPYDLPGDCRYYCRSTRLSYYSKHMTKEIRVASVYDDAGSIDLILCNGNTTSLTNPVVLYLTSYDPINWVIDSNDTHILENIVIVEIYAEYLRTDKGKSTVTLSDMFSQSNPKIIIKKDSWAGYGDDEESNEILHNVQERYNLELYSFCGGYSGDISLCVGEQDIPGNKYVSDDKYEQCDIPLPVFAQSMIYVACVFAFWCILCCGLAGIRKLLTNKKKKKAEKRRLERMQKEQFERDERNRKRKERVEMERIREKNKNVYVGEEEIGNMKIKDELVTDNRRSKYSDNYTSKKNGNKVSLSGDELPTYGQLENENKKDEIISKQGTLSYSAMSCVICLDVLLENEATKLLCGHKFHIHCIEEYNESNDNCPLCRKRIE